jgi:hypothetical protein
MDELEQVIQRLGESPSRVLFEEAERKLRSCALTLDGADWARLFRVQSDLERIKQEQEQGYL